jgi:hypothetical protein
VQHVQVPHPVDRLGRRQGLVGVEPHELQEARVVASVSRELGARHVSVVLRSQRGLDEIDGDERQSLMVIDVVHGEPPSPANLTSRAQLVHHQCTDILVDPLVD